LHAEISLDKHKGKPDIPVMAQAKATPQGKELIA
jgi:hypothetical protein